MREIDRAQAVASQVLARSSLAQGAPRWPQGLRKVPAGCRGPRPTPTRMGAVSGERDRDDDPGPGYTAVSHVQPAGQAGQLWTSSRPEWPAATPRLSRVSTA